MFLISRKNPIREKREIKSDANITTYTVILYNGFFSRASIFRGFRGQAVVRENRNPAKSEIGQNIW